MVEVAVFVLFVLDFLSFLFMIKKWKETGIINILNLR